jgi:DNA mismatch repair protein PMS2
MICSIFTLQLIENSLDSGATVIEVKLKNLGGDSIEVSDNGGGIEPNNYAGLAMKHHTSKLQQFSDLTAVSSFGFRGEALNALCELSGSFSVVTRQSSQAVASSLSFKRNGELDGVAKTSRAPGTSVLVSNLFEVLPVRRTELLR